MVDQLSWRTGTRQSTTNIKYILKIMITHNIADRLNILIDNYHTHQTPNLTMIYLWDEKVDFLLSSRYDPLTAGMREAGMPRDDNDSDEVSLSVSSIAPSTTGMKVSPSSSRKNSKKASECRNKN